MTEMTALRSRLIALSKHPPILAAIVISIVLIGLFFLKFNANIYGFFRIGSILPYSPYLDPNKALIYRGELGFDGQQFLSIAFDPLLQNPDTISTLDSPRLRYRRILYPLLGHLFGLGNVRLIPYALVAINIVTILGLISILTQFFESKKPNLKGRSLLILCLPGLWISLSFSTADLLNTLFTISAFCTYRNSKISRTAIALALAYLTKEISVLMGIALIFNSTLKRNGKQILYLLAAFIPAALWNLYVLFKLQSQGFLGVTENFGPPLFGIAQKISTLLSGGGDAKNLFEAYNFLLLLCIFAANIALSKQARPENRVILLATLLYGVLFISSGMAMLGYFLNYPRQYMDVYFLLLLTRVERFEPLKLALILAAGLSSLTFIFFHR